LSLAVVALAVVWPELARVDRGLPITISEPRGGEDDSLRMANPRYTGADDQNRPFAITAETATLDRLDRRRVNLSRLHADITLEDNRWLSLTAPNGVYQQDRQFLELGGPVEVYSDEGYELHARSARVDIQGGTAESDEPVAGHGPLGELNANAFRLDRRSQTLTFENGVRVVIHAAAGRS
jgi:lipopolysaccharide export system protein LptC